MVRIPAALERPAMTALRAAHALQAASPPTRDHCPQFRADVTVLRDVSPAFRRVTLRADELRDLTLTGPDEYVGLFMPEPGLPLQMPENRDDPRAAVAALPVDTRPGLRWYTIRAHRPEKGEIDIDIVRSGHDGPGAVWIRDVCVGDEVGVRVCVSLYGSAPEVGHHLLLADETGLPGMLAVLDAYGDDPGRRFTALVEVPSEDFLHGEVDDAGTHVVFRGSRTPGSALQEALTGADLAPVDYAWICAEGGAVAACRRHVVRRLNVPRRSVMASGFWKLGQPRS